MAGNLKSNSYEIISLIAQTYPLYLSLHSLALSLSRRAKTSRKSPQKTGWTII